MKVLGRGLINAKPEPDGRQYDEGEEVGCVFLIARRNAPTVLDLIEEAFDLISVAVKIRAEANRITPVPAGRDVRQPPRELTNARNSVAS